MRVFRYKIYKNDNEVLMNWINAEDRQEAMLKLEDVKQEMNADEIRLTEVFGASEWSCQ